MFSNEAKKGCGFEKEGRKEEMNLGGDGRWKFLILIYYISNKYILISKTKK